MKRLLLVLLLTAASGVVGVWGALMFLALAPDNPNRITLDNPLPTGPRAEDPILADPGADVPSRPIPAPTYRPEPAPTSQAQSLPTIQPKPAPTGRPWPSSPARANPYPWSDEECRWVDDTLALDAALDLAGIPRYPTSEAYYRRTAAEWERLRSVGAGVCRGQRLPPNECVPYTVGPSYDQFGRGALRSLGYGRLAHQPFSDEWNRTWAANYTRLIELFSRACPPYQPSPSPTSQATPRLANPSPTIHIAPSQPPTVPWNWTPAECRWVDDVLALDAALDRAASVRWRDAEGRADYRRYAAEWERLRGVGAGVCRGQPLPPNECAPYPSWGSWWSEFGRGAIQSFTAAELAHLVGQPGAWDRTWAENYRRLIVLFQRACPPTLPGKG